MLTTSAQSIRLPIVRIVAGALLLSWERRHRLWGAAWLPFVLGVLITMAESFWGPSAWAKKSALEDSVPQGSALPWILPVLALTVVVAVRSYRVFLLDGKRAHLPAPISWGMAETRFIFTMAIVAFVFIAAFMTFGGFVSSIWPGVATVVPGWLFLILLFLLPAWVSARLWLAFPPLAIGRMTEILLALSRSWQLTRNNGLSMLTLCVITPSLIAWTLGQISRLSMPGIELICAVVVWLVIPLELAIVALCYTALEPDLRTGSEAE